MNVTLYRLAAQAMDDTAALPVLGDFIQEGAWFDARVLQVMWPLGRAPRHGWSTKKKRDRAKVDREDAKGGYPNMFAGFTARPTHGFARAVVAVLLFGEWSKRRWLPVKRRSVSPARAWVPWGGAR